MPKRIRDGAVVTVVEVSGQKAFEIDGLRIDKLDCYDLFQMNIINAVYLTSGTTGLPLPIEIFRDGKLFDTGTIETIGTHGAIDVISGLIKTVLLKRPDGSLGDDRTLSLTADDFEVDDQIKPPITRTRLKNKILEYWYSSILSENASYKAISDKYFKENISLYKANNKHYNEEVVKIDSEEEKKKLTKKHAVEKSRIRTDYRRKKTTSQCSNA